MHPRKAIRHAAANLLLGNPQTDLENPIFPLADADPLRNVGANVFASRSTPTFIPERPCVCLYTIEEDADDRDTEPKNYWRTVKLIAEIFAEANEGVDDILDDIAEKVEATLLPLRFLKDPVSGNETADNVTLKRTEIILKGTSVENVIGSCSIEIDVDYNTEVDWAAITDDFQKMGVTYKLTSNSFALPVTDTVALQGA